MKLQQLWALAVLLASPATAKCIIDPDSKESVFHIVGKDLVPVVKKKRCLQLAKSVHHATNDDVPVFHFQKSPSAPAGVYDMVMAEDDPAKSQFVGKADDGSLVLTPASTGPTGQEVDGKKVATSIFTVDCKGHIGATYEGKSSALTIQSPDSTYHALDAYNYDVDVFLEKAKSASRILAKRDDTTRCPAGQNASPLASPPDKRPNGCGDPKFGKLVPEFSFTECCNAHDLCFWDCAVPTMSDCNNHFSDCMFNVCDDRYHGFKKPLLAACKVIASIYTAAVHSRYAAKIFEKESAEYCTCTGSK